MKAGGKEVGKVEQNSEVGMRKEEDNRDRILGSGRKAHGGRWKGEKVREIIPGRFSNLHPTFIVICVICEICGLKGPWQKTWARQLEPHYPSGESDFADSDFSMDRSAPLLSKRIWQICSEMRLNMKMRIAVTNKKTLILVNRLWVT